MRSASLLALTEKRTRSRGSVLCEEVVVKGLTAAELAVSVGATVNQSPVRYRWNQPAYPEEDRVSLDSCEEFIKPKPEAKRAAGPLYLPCCSRCQRRRRESGSHRVLEPRSPWLISATFRGRSCFASGRGPPPSFSELTVLASLVWDVSPVCPRVENPPLVHRAGGKVGLVI